MAEERIQRELAAIAAADLVGYSRLMERVEAGTHAGLKGPGRAELNTATKPIGVAPRTIQEAQTDRWEISKRGSQIDTWIQGARSQR